MLFSTPTPFKLEPFIINSYNSLEEFNNEISARKYFLLKKYGFVSFLYESQFTYNIGMFLLKINDDLYGIMCNTDSNTPPNEMTPLFFDKIIKLNNEFLSTYLFEMTNSNNYIKQFDADLKVDSKFYNYNDEYKILISKYGLDHISLFVSLQNSKQDNSFTLKIFPAAHETAKEISMKDLIEKRFAMLKTQ